MTYQHLIQSMRQYSQRDDLCLGGLGIAGSRIRENVILSPGWPPQRVAGLGEARLLVESGPLYGLSVWEIVRDGQALTYIKTGCGAPAVLDTLLSLGESGCRRVIFLSSVGALAPEMAVGDLVLPEWAACGDGASRYLSDSLADSFGEKSYPHPSLYALLHQEAARICQKHGLALHTGRPFCTDTFLAQFPHFPAMLAMGCNALDMESGVAFRAAAQMGLPLAALSCVSDNSLGKKSLLGGVTEEEQRRRRFVREQIIPEILQAVLWGKEAS